MYIVAMIADAEDIRNISLGPKIPARYPEIIPIILPYIVLNVPSKA